VTHRANSYSTKTSLKILKTNFKPDQNSGEDGEEADAPADPDHDGDPAEGRPSVAAFLKKKKTKLIS
jgi:hypothetical protein